jgi:DNA-binding NarL/FixJ family response regulator
MEKSSEARRPDIGHRRVLIVDDHPIVREGLLQLIAEEADLQICAEADTASDARTAILDHAPDVMVVDINLKTGGGIELIRSVHAEHPHLPILVFSIHDEAIYAQRMLAIGASGYLMKQADSSDVLVALRRVLEGKTYVSKTVGAAIIQRCAASNTAAGGDPLDCLSNRELQVLHMVGEGRSTRETAESLRLSVKTIESHRQRIKRKLNLGTGSQLVQYAVNWLVGDNKHTVG